MDGRLRDIRILKLAEFYERAYEEFALEMTARYVKDLGARAEIRRLAESAERHSAQIAELLTWLSEKVPESERHEVERAALLDILDVERAAREFYLAHLDTVRTPAVADLFRTLAHEASEGIRMTEAALAMVEGRRGPRVDDLQGEPYDPDRGLPLSSRLR